MNLSDMPTRVAIPFANGAGSGYIRSIPVPSQTGGAASFTDGFPADTFQPLSGGGAYVNGEDVNGILNHVTKWTRWQAAGGAAVYSSTFASNVGGYPKGAVLKSTAQDGLLWQNTVDGNLTDPDGGSAAGWVPVGPTAADLATVEAGTDVHKFINSAVLQQLFTPFQNSAGHSLTLGPVRIQWGRANTVTNLAPSSYVTAYPQPFAGPAHTVLTWRNDQSGRNYNQKKLFKQGVGDANGFPWGLQNDDSGDAGSYVYSFDWLAIGDTP